MRKFIKRLIIGSAIILAAVLLSAAIMASFFEEQISQKLLSEINKQLETELEVQEFDLSILSGFPNASADLKGVSLSDQLKGKLLAAEKVSFRFGLLSLFSSNIKVNSVVIKNGAIHIRKDRKGVANYDILKTSESSPETSADPADFSISLKEALLENVEIVYMDDRLGQEMIFQVKDAVFSGQFADDQFSLNSDAQVTTKFIKLKGVRYFVGKNLAYGATIEVDLERGKYQLENVEVELEGNSFLVDGSILAKNNFTDYDLALTGKDGNLEGLFKLLPEQYMKYLSDFSTRGKFLFHTTVKGRSSASESPAIDLDLSLKNGRITSKKLEDPLKDVSFTAQFTNGKSRSMDNAVFEINDFKGYFSRELIESQLQVVDFKNPTVDFQIDGVIPMESVFGLFNSEAITDGAGEVEIHNFKIKGRYSDMINTGRIHRVKTSGNLEFDDAELVINKERMIVDKGTMSLRDNELLVKEVKVEGAGSEVLLNGKFENVIPVLFADKINSENAELKFTASLESEELDLDRWERMLIYSKESEFTVKGEFVDSVKIQQIHERERLTNFLKGNFKLNVEALNYNLIQGTDFEGDLIFDNNEVLISGDVETMEGAMNLEGRAFFEESPYVKAQLVAAGIDFREFFRQCENFGQEVLRYQHLKGRLDSRISINAYWDKQGKFLHDKLHVLADVNIADGELVRFKMLEDFSNYVKIRDLRHIKFTHLQNWLEVKNQMVYMPVMFVQSNALNLTINGQHSFKNKIDYKVKVNAGQVLLNKFKSHDRTLRPQKAKQNGWFNLYYQVKGDIDDYEIISNKRLVKEDFMRSERRKREIRYALIREFGSVKSIEEPLEWQDEKPSEDLDEVEFLEGFEEETADKPIVSNKPPIRPVVEEKPEDDDVEYLDVFDDLPPPKEKKKTDPKKKNS